MIIKRNPQGEYPQIKESTWADQTSVIIGNVKIGKNVFIGPHAVIRADEPGSSIVIKDNCNIQDGVIIHAFKNSSVQIEENTSLAHGCIIHGPCKIDTGSFIGFNSIVVNANLEKEVVVKHLTVIENVNIPAGKVVDSKMCINNKDSISKLKDIDDKLRKFSEEVVKTNLGLVKGYKSEESKKI